MNYMNNNETITSISTAAGTGAIGIIRISGKDAFKIANLIFVGKKGIFEKNFK